MLNKIPLKVLRPSINKWEKILLKVQKGDLYDNPMGWDDLQVIGNCSLCDYFTLKKQNLPECDRCPLYSLSYSNRKYCFYTPVLAPTARIPSPYSQKNYSKYIKIELIDANIKEELLPYFWVFHYNMQYRSKQCYNLEKRKNIDKKGRTSYNFPELSPHQKNKKTSIQTASRILKGLNLIVTNKNDH